MIERLNSLVWDSGIPVGDQSIPFVVIALIGTGVFLTLRLAFIQLRRLGHGFAVTSGRYDDPRRYCATSPQDKSLPQLIS